MDKNFEPIEQLYLSQAFDTDNDDEQMLTECKMIARTYALAEKIHGLRLVCERFLPQHMDAFDQSITRSNLR